MSENTAKEGFITMKASQFHTFGGPEVLKYEEVPIPTLKPGEIRVRVKAIGLNPPDWYLRDGLKGFPPEWKEMIQLPMIPGTDVSGIVESITEDVADFAIGDEVFGMIRFPLGIESHAYAEYVTGPSTDFAIKPTSVDHIQSAAAPMSILTAWQFLIDNGTDHPNPLQSHPHIPIPLAGKKVLINGAAGGVGHYALQLAKWKGAEVIAVASGKNEMMLKDLGADEFIDYNKQSPEDILRDLDLVVDCVGGPSTSRFLKTIKNGGYLFPVFFTGIENAAEAQQRSITISTTQVHSNGKQLAEIATLMDQGIIRTIIDSTFPLSEAHLAHQRAEKGHIQGKIVLVV